MRGAVYRANCLPGPREPFQRDTVYLEPRATDGVGGYFSQEKSDTVFRSNVGGRRHLSIFSVRQRKTGYIMSQFFFLSVDVQMENLNYRRTEDIYL